MWLAHHGIKGQKWGVRRYQNADGSLTDAGKKHYGKGLAGHIKRKRENALLRINMDRNKLNRDNDKLLEEIIKGEREHDKMMDKWSDLDDRSERLTNKAAEVNTDKAWKEAGEAGTKAEKYWDSVRKKDEANNALWDKQFKTSDKIKELDNVYNKMAEKYSKKYGSKELNKLPKTDKEIMDRFIDDSISLISGEITKKQFNKKYEGTGFKAS